MTGLARLLGSLGSDGRDFERVCQWYLENAPEYRGVVKRVSPWMGWSGRWGADAGIDLVVETGQGDLWAVQAKAYDASYAVTKRDVDSFLSESNRPVFAYRLLIATTDRIAHHARSAMEGQEKPVGLRLRSDLEAADLEWPASSRKLLPVKAKPKRLRPHQRRAVRDVVDGFTRSRRGQLLMACGTGKTLVGLHVAEELRARRTLVLLQSLSLVEQTLREWTANSPRPFVYLAVCSDESVADHDSVVASTTELGVPVTTDPDKVAAFLRRRHGHAVVFATYQSSGRIALAHQRTVPAFDLVIADEAHRCAGPEAGVFATVLGEAKIKARRRLFMTATPRFFTGRVRKAGLEADYEVASMDDQEQFGPAFHRLTFAKAIEQDLLSDYQLVVVGVSDKTYHDYAQRGVFVTADGKTVTDARTLASQLGLLRAMARHDLHRVVSFHSRIANARSFASALHDVNDWLPARRRPNGTLWTEHVSGAMSSGLRRVRINRLRDGGTGERGVLSNARCLTEGVDVPTLDGVAFIDPRRSQVDIVQAVGRAIRKAEDKTVGTIVVPVFVDEDADPERALESGEFDCVWQIVRALRSHDEVLADELDELRREAGRRKVSLGRPPRILLDLPLGVEHAFARAFDAKVVEVSTAPWEFWFGLLQRFVAREGEARFPKDYAEDGFRLGSWVNDQRNFYRAGRISKERVARLEAIPGWTWHPFEDAWERGYDALRVFVEDAGHARVPKGYEQDGFKLGSWVEVQRRFFANARLDQSRVERLMALKGWSWNIRDEDWEEGFAHLQAFVSRERHARVPCDFVQDRYSLGAWTARLRAAYTRGDVPPERAARLAELPGWEWHRHDAAWERGYTRVKSFVERTGHARVPAQHSEDGVKLGVWVSGQRTAYRLGRLSRDRVARLEELRGWEWDPFGPVWEEGFTRLQAFAERERHAQVPANYVEDGYRLGSLVKEQRRLRRDGRLRPERIASLERIVDWTWHTLDTRWEEGWRLLVRYVEREGQARVPQSHIESDFRLGRWVNVQRRRWRAGRLSQERTLRLEKLSGWAWDTRTQ